MESPATESDLFAFLDSLDIPHQTYSHPAVFTVEEAQAIRNRLPNAASMGHSKNLFVRDKKKKHALVVAGEDQTINLKDLSSTIDMGRLSFASPERLMVFLGVEPGSVTPFALFNAYRVHQPDQPVIKVVLDETLMSCNTVCFHPLHNAATTAIAPQNLVKFIKACGFDPQIINLQT